jgi:hypothetical protein
MAMMSPGATSSMWSLEMFDMCPTVVEANE